MRFIVLSLIVVLFFPLSCQTTRSHSSRDTSIDDTSIVDTNIVSTRWTFAKVKIKGSIVGKDRFLHYYALEPGQVFDEAKHKHSLATIENELRQEGYLDAKVNASKQYDTKHKAVVITLTLNPGTLFTIADVTVVLKGAAQKELPALHEKLQELVSQDLLHANVLKETINGEARKIKDSLMSQGYARVRISLVTKRISAKEVSLSYHVTIQQKKRYKCKGNVFYSTEALMQELFSESQGMSVHPEVLAEDMSALYKKKGFRDVTVSVQALPSSVLFIINEGPRLKIADVSVVGMPAEADALKKKVINELQGMTDYDEDAIKQVLANLSSELAEYGYWAAQTTKMEMTQNNSLDLIVRVNPGELQIVKAIDINGYPDLLKQEPFIQILKNLPRPLGPAVLEEQRKWLLNYFRQKGYVYVTVQHEYKGQTLIWRVDTRGGLVHFGKTSVSGLYRMKPQIVLRELYFKEGDVWDKEKIEQTVKRLRALGMFESVSIEQTTIEHDRGTVEQPCSETALYQPVIIKCIEEDPFEIRTRFGLQFVSKSFTHINWSTYKVGGSFVWKNPACLADQLRFDADFTRFTRNLAASYELPWIGPCPVRTLFSVYSNRFDQPLSTSKEHKLYKEAHDGFSVTFNHLHRWWQSNVMAGFEVNQLYGISPELAKVIQFEPVLVDKNTPYLYIEPSMTIEKLDNKMDPCSGFLTFLSCKAMVPPGIKGGAFVRALFEQSFYQSLLWNVVGALRFRFGHIFNAKFSTILPTERFYLGGATTLRGYETNMVPPLNDLECSHRCLWVPVGGKSMVNINAELRFPIYRPFCGVVFTDMGVLAEIRFADIAANKWLGASGFGLVVRLLLARFGSISAGNGRSADRKMIPMPGS